MKEGQKRSRKYKKPRHSNTAFAGKRGLIEKVRRKEVDGPAQDQ